MPDVCALLPGIHRRKQSLPKRKLGKMFTYDPISPVAMEISNETCLLCFDEFQVSECVADGVGLSRSNQSEVAPEVKSSVVV